jgi:hypothetical protein
VPWSKARIYCGIINKQLEAENKGFGWNKGKNVKRCEDLGILKSSFN